MLSREKIEGQTNENCFGCGRENPIGLKLGFHSDGGSVKAEFTPSKLYEGYPGYLHGGIIFTVLDEAMGWAAHDLSSGVFAVTARSQIRFRRPVPTGEPLTIAALITRKTRKFHLDKGDYQAKGWYVGSRSHCDHGSQPKQLKQVEGRHLDVMGKGIPHACEGEPHYLCPIIQLNSCFLHL